MQTIDNVTKNISGNKIIIFFQNARVFIIVILSLLALPHQLFLLLDTWGEICIKGSKERFRSINSKNMYESSLIIT